MPRGERHTWTPEQVAFVRAYYPHYQRRHVAYMINEAFNLFLTEMQIKVCVRKYNLVCNRNGKFMKGNINWNKGTKGLCKPNSGSFKKGDMPGNVKPMWTERICPKDGFILMKVPRPNPYTKSESRYMHKHVYIWEEEYGPVPGDHVIRFIDGDKLNCVIDNLECISRSLHCRMNKNRVGSLPAEVRQSGRLIAEIQQARGKLKKESQNASK